MSVDNISLKRSTTPLDYSDWSDIIDLDCWVMEVHAPDNDTDIR